MPKGNRWHRLGGSEVWSPLTLSPAPPGRVCSHLIGSPVTRKSRKMQVIQQQMWLLISFTKSLPGSVQTFSFSLSCRWRSLSSSNPAEPSVHISSSVLGPQGQIGQVWLRELFPSLHLKFSLDWEDSPTQQHLHYYQFAEMWRGGTALLRWICRCRAFSLWIDWVSRWRRWFSCIHQRKVIEHSVNLMGISYREWYLQEGKP